MVAQRARDVELSGIRRMFEGAPPTAVNLGLGEPDFDPPAEVVAALCEAVQNGMNHYGPSAGLTSLRERVAERYQDRDPDTTRENIVITAGGSAGLMSTALALYDPGDEVLVPNPGFVLYTPQARLTGAIPVPYDLAEKNRFLPNIDDLEARVTPRTRAIVVNSPSNPTGSVFPGSTVERILDFAETHDVMVISDEVYEDMIYEGKFTSFWGKGDRTVIVNSFSKTLAMTGWRLGFIVAPKALAPEINKMNYHMNACPSTPVQSAAIAGLIRYPRFTHMMVREFRARRALVMKALAGISGLRCAPPAGAFYAFPRFTWPGSSQEVAGDLLQRGLITTPGDAFGTLGAGHLRLSFAASRENLHRGMAILRAYGREVR
ncbi:MAG: pyridoxal phosphate-dependent aminotransferase [Thermoplasmata archaeon]